MRSRRRETCPWLVKRRLVCRVIAETDTVDAQGDVISDETIEEMAHNFLLRSRKFDNRHDWRAVDAAPVESWIQREATVLLGRGSRPNRGWSVKVFADHIWQKVLSKEYQSFSIGGRGGRVPRVRFGLGSQKLPDMPSMINTLYTPNG